MNKIENNKNIEMIEAKRNRKKLKQAAKGIDNINAEIKNLPNAKLPQLVGILERILIRQRAIIKTLAEML